MMCVSLRMSLLQPLLLLLFFSGTMLSSAEAGRHWNHGGIQMGIPEDNCDNGTWNLEMDWVKSSTYEYTCQDTETPWPEYETEPLVSCLLEDDIPDPLHKCMSENITYIDKPPRGGPHRPLWPGYGEYLYCPPQRWVHSLEHGAAVFLYHPCAPPQQVEDLKLAAKSCLRRHIITPYRDLSIEQPLAVVTWGCKMTMSSVEPRLVKQYIKDHALMAPERHVWEDGQYNYTLLEQATVVSDKQDHNLCPN